MASIVILGAGLSGLSAAYHLEKNLFFDYSIFEREAVVGGLCRSETENGFTFDYTGHLIHINDPYFKAFLEDIFDFNDLNLIDRKSFIYSHGVYTSYPFQTNLYGLPISVIADCIKGYITRKRTIKAPKNFYDWVLKHFGLGIGKHFLFSYNQKLWNYSLHEMDHSWTGRFVPATSLEAIIEGALSKPTKKLGYNSSFYYPKSGGIQQFPTNLAKKLKNSIHTNSSVCKIDMQNKLVHFENGRSESYEILISTLPLDRLIALSKTTSDINFSAVQDNLKCNSLVNFNLGVDIANLTDKHWIYLPEKKYPFYRIGFWNNFASSMAPKFSSSLYGEFTYLPQKTSKAQIRILTNKSIEQALKILGLSKTNILTQKILHIDHAYVIYDFWRQNNLHKILNTLVDKQIYSIGRFGEWKYSSMQEAILDGKLAADTILANNKFKIYAAHKTTFNNVETVLPAQKDTQVSVQS